VISPDSEKFRDFFRYFSETITESVTQPVR
jgi:hypothetical protein